MQHKYLIFIEYLQSKLNGPFIPNAEFNLDMNSSSLWISEEKELVHEIAGLGELREPWHTCQMTWLQNHLNLLNTYNTALENLDNYKG